jgi:hypothetical protein
LRTFGRVPGAWRRSYRASPRVFKLALQGRAFLSVPEELLAMPLHGCLHAPDGFAAALVLLAAPQRFPAVLPPGRVYRVAGEVAGQASQKQDAKDGGEEAVTHGVSSGRDWLGVAPL